jgi:hypothetical protein
MPKVDPELIQKRLYGANRWLLQKEP